MIDRLRVLVVEDNPADADLIREILPEAGPVSFAVESVPRLSDALARLKRGDLELIIIDLGLPDSQGLDTFHKLRDAAPNIATIVLTGNDDLVMAITAVREGAQDYLVKGQVGGEMLVRSARYAVERKRAEEELKKLAHKIRLILDSAGEGIFGVDLDGNVTFINPAAARMLGYEVEELLGKQSHATLHHHNPDRTAMSIEQCSLHKALRKGTSGLAESAVFFKKDGTQCPIEFSSTLMFEADSLVGAVVIFRDMTSHFREEQERKKLEDQLRQAQKMEAIGRLAGGVAHDFNNLTAVVIGYAELLLHKLRPEDPLCKHAEQIMAAGVRAAALTRQLLAFSRRQALLPEVLDLNALLVNFKLFLGRLIGEDIELTFNLAADPGRVLADPGQLEQVVTNLAVNARDAMPHGGKLTVETAAVEIDETCALGSKDVVPGGYVLLTLTDTGCGMDQATQDRLFEPFFTTKEKGKGTGLGLATVHGIVKQSGGHIEVASELGRGSSFKIYLPRTDAQPQAKTAEITEEMPRGRGELILLVEDEAPLSELYRKVLTQLGYRVRAAGNSAEALRLVRDEKLDPDLVFTDVIMPGMSGVELAKRLRAERPGLRVLYMSGYTDETIAPHGILDPGVPFIQKPVTERVLATKVREVLGEIAAAAAPPCRSILMIDDDEQYRQMVQHFCAKRGHLFVGVDSTAAALAALAGSACDVLLVDLNIPGASGEQVLREIRAAGHVAPAIVLTGDVASADMDLLRQLGVVQALEKSSNTEPLLRAIEAVALA